MKCEYCDIEISRPYYFLEPGTQEDKKICEKCHDSLIDQGVIIDKQCAELLDLYVSSFKGHPTVSCGSCRKEMAIGSQCVWMFDPFNFSGKLKGTIWFFCTDCLIDLKKMLQNIEDEKMLKWAEFLLGYKK